MNKDLKDRMVPCIRTGKGAQTGDGKSLEPGQALAFASGSAYVYMSNGSLLRLGKDRSKSKSERKRLKRERTMDRLYPPAE